MKRREFITLLGGATVAWPLAAGAQQPAMPVVGFLHPGSASAFGEQAAAFREGLQGAGYAEGHNVVIEYRWAEGQYDRLPELATDLVHLRATVIAAVGGDIVPHVVMKATSIIPIVFVIGQDPIRSGLVASLNRPGGNITGVTLFVNVLVPKQMELVHKIVPNATLIAVLMNPDNPTVLPDATDLEKAARANGMELLILNASTAEELDAAFTAMTNRHVGALLVPGDPFFTSRRSQIVTLATRHAIPAIYPFREYAAAGGLMSYGNNLMEAARLATVYIACPRNQYLDGFPG